MSSEQAQLRKLIRALEKTRNLLVPPTNEDTRRNQIVATADPKLPEPIQLRSIACLHAALTPLVDEVHLHSTRLAEQHRQLQGEHAKLASRHGGVGNKAKESYEQEIAALRQKMSVHADAHQQEIGEAVNRAQLALDDANRARQQLERAMREKTQARTERQAIKHQEELQRVHELHAERCSEYDTACSAQKDERARADAMARTMQQQASEYQAELRRMHALHAAKCSEYDTTCAAHKEERARADVMTRTLQNTQAETAEQAEEARRIARQLQQTLAVREAEHKANVSVAKQQVSEERIKYSEHMTTATTETVALRQKLDAATEAHQAELQQHRMRAESQRAAVQEQLARAQYTIQQLQASLDACMSKQAEQDATIQQTKSTMHGAHQETVSALVADAEELRRRLSACGMDPRFAGSQQPTRMSIGDREQEREPAAARFATSEITSANYGPAYAHWHAALPTCPGGPCCGAGAGLRANSPSSVAEVAAWQLDGVLRAVGRMCNLARMSSGPLITIMRIVAVIPNCSVAEHADAALSTIARDIEVCCSAGAVEESPDRFIAVTIRARPAREVSTLDSTAWAEADDTTQVTFDGPVAAIDVPANGKPTAASVPADLRDGLIRAIGGCDPVAASIVGENIPQSVPVLLCMPPLCKSLRNPIIAHLVGGKLALVPGGGPIERLERARDLFIWG